jgi:drug/metabolite transporter (DMT)-like permease
MFAAFLAAFFFALNATCARHSVRAVGTLRANLGRLVIAALLLGLFAHTVGHGFASVSVGWFMLSGLIGMGLGDLGVYGALPLLGSRLTVLMTQCLAAPIAALGEWLWLGTKLTSQQVFWGSVILVGVAVAVMPSKPSVYRDEDLQKRAPKVHVKPIGFLFGLLAAAGQGFGALVSRKGVTVAAAAGEHVTNATFGLTATYHRILAGLMFIGLWILVLRLFRRLPPAPVVSPAVRRTSARWMLANALAGPVAGVGCYQWALATTPSGLVLPIAATTPLLAIPIAFWLEGDRPTRRSILGAVIAVAGCIALTLNR